MSAASLARLEATEDAKVQGEVLDELCTMLCIGMEDYVRGFDVELAVKVLVKLLKKTQNDNIVILSCRAIALILEMIPRSCRHVVAAGTVPLLINFLGLAEHNPELAEEILKSCDKIGVDDPQALLTCQGAVQAIIASMKMAPPHLHKTAVAILSNICRKVPHHGKTKSPSTKGRRHEASSDQDALVMQEIIPALLKLLDQAGTEAGREVVERVCICIANVADVRGMPLEGAQPSSRVIHLVKAGILPYLLRPLYMPLKGEQEQKQADMMLKLLGLICSAAPSLAVERLLGPSDLTPPFLRRVVELLLPDSTDYSQVLHLPFRTGGGLFGQSSGTSGPGVATSSDYIPALLHLLSTLLPPLPPSALCYHYPQMVPYYTWAWEDDYHNFSPYDKIATETLEAAYCKRAPNTEIMIRGMRYMVDLDQMKQRNRSSGVTRNVLRHAIASGFRRQGSAAPPAPPPPAAQDSAAMPAMEFRSRVFGGLRAIFGPPDADDESTQDRTRVEENKLNPMDISPVEAALLTASSSHEVYRQSPALAFEWLDTVVPALIQLANLTTDSSVRLWCVELVARIVSLCVAASKHMPPTSPKGTARSTKGKPKCDGDWLGLNRQLKNAAFALTGFLGDVVARAESDSAVDHALYVCGLLAAVGTKSLRQLLQRSGLPTILQTYCTAPERGPPKSPKSPKSAEAPKSPDTTGKQKLQTRAKSLLDRHLLKAEADDQQDDAESQLKQIAATLAQHTSSAEGDDAAGSAISQLLELLTTEKKQGASGTKEGAISTFEFINSGVAEALLHYLTYDVPHTASSMERLKAAQTRGGRIRAFAETLQQSPNMMATLLRYLQQSLSVAEKFPTQPECLAQPAGALTPTLRPCASVKEFFRLLSNKIFKVRLVDGNAPPTEQAGSTKEKKPEVPTEKSKGKRKRAKKPAKDEEPTPESKAVEKYTTVDPLATVGCMERYVARAVELGKVEGHVCGSLRARRGDGQNGGDSGLDSEDSGDDLGFQFCMDDEDDDFGSEEDYDEEDDDDEHFEGDFASGFTFHIAGDTDDMDLEAQIISHLTASQSSGSHSNTKVQPARQRRTRYYLWMEGVGRLPQAATVLHAITNYHLTHDKSAEFLSQIDRLFTTPSAKAHASSRAERELELQRLERAIRQQELHWAQLEEEARLSATPGSKKKKKKKKVEDEVRGKEAEVQREEAHAQHAQQQVKRRTERRRSEADRMAECRERLQQDIAELFPNEAEVASSIGRRHHGSGRSLWERTYTVYFTTSPKPPAVITSSAAASSSSAEPSLEEVEELAKVMALSPWDQDLSLAPGVPASFSTSLASESIQFGNKSEKWMAGDDIMGPILQLMRVLHLINHSSPAKDSPLSVLDRKDFHNHQVTSKLMQALAANAVAVALLGPAALPAWCPALTLQYRFLFPYEARKEYFTFTSFGALRALYSYLANNPHLRYIRADIQADYILGAIKARVERNAILQDTDAVLFECADRRAPLDVMYNDEAGTGLGPTLELFTLVSQQLQQKCLGLWRGDDDVPAPIPVPQPQADKGDKDSPESSLWPPLPETKEYLQSKEGLFPKALGDALTSPVICNLTGRFVMIGRFLARALQDGRLLDLHFAPFFLDLLAHWTHWKTHPGLLGPKHISLVDSVLGQSLKQVLDLALQASGQDSTESAAAIQALHLNFTLPGTAEATLVPGGEEMMVNETNAIHYVWMVCHQLLLRRVVLQMEALLEGFEEALPTGGLGVFDPEELEQLWCGQVTDTSAPLWTRDELVTALVCAHGYTMDSPEIVDLIAILCEDFSPKQQQLFLIFLTGSSRLPAGGITAVQPKITVVRKGVAMPQFAGGAAEGDSANALPSCNTCFHYLKLPSYGSRATLREKLLLAVEEGREAFSLS